MYEEQLEQETLAPQLEHTRRSEPTITEPSSQKAFRLEAHIRREATETLPCPARCGEGVGRGQNDIVQSIKTPKMTTFWLTWFGSFICTKQRRFVFCHIGLYLPRWKTTRFGLSEGRESIKMTTFLV